jgi:hypothetical protein
MVAVESRACLGAVVRVVRRCGSPSISGGPDELSRRAMAPHAVTYRNFSRIAAHLLGMRKGRSPPLDRGQVAKNFIGA